MTNDEIVERIFEIRVANNFPWKKLMKLALKHAPEEAKEALREITDNDIMVSALVRDLTR